MVACIIGNSENKMTDNYQTHDLLSILRIEGVLFSSTNISPTCLVLRRAELLLTSTSFLHEIKISNASQYNYSATLVRIGLKYVNSRNGRLKVCGPRNSQQLPITTLVNFL